MMTSEGGHQQQQASAEVIFDAADTDRDGYITRLDLERLCASLQLDDSVDDLLSQLGVGDRDRISRDEFVAGNRSKLGRSRSRTNMEDSEAALFRSPMPNRPPSRQQQQQQQHYQEQQHYRQPQVPQQQQQQTRSAPPNVLQLANSVHMSAIASLKSDIDSLTAQLSSVTADRDRLLARNHVAAADRNHVTAAAASADRSTSGHIPDQRYEERIVELHSVIAELSRKLSDARGDVIREESELDESNLEEESNVEEDDEEGVDEHDYNSLAFERDLERHAKAPRSNSSGASRFSGELLELTSVREDLAASLRESADLRQRLSEAEVEVSEARTERDAFRRQLEDLKTTLEYREAVMDKAKEESNGNGVGEMRKERRASAERRSLRRRRHERESSREQACLSPTKLRSDALPPGDTSSVSSSLCSASTVSASAATRLRELQLELDIALTRAEHLEAQNELLNLTLEDSKALTDRLTVLLGKYESNNTALQLALGYCDHTVEAYDVLVALLETESTSNRKAAEAVAAHLLSRVDKAFGTHGHGSGTRADSGIGGSHLDTTWEDSSGYSQTTTSSTSTTSSCLADSASPTSHFSKAEEHRLRGHISSLKTIRASIQNSIVELEPLHNDPDIPLEADRSTSSSGVGPKEIDMEMAVMQQELMASREERADLRAKVYLLEKEKASHELVMQDRSHIELTLRTHIQHLQEELGLREQAVLSLHGMVTTPTGSGSDSGRQSQLRQRVENLLSTLEKVTRNSELKQKQSSELIDDLKKANSTLTEALERSRKKYQAKLRKMEQQLLNYMKEDPALSGGAKPIKSAIPVPIKHNKAQ